MLLATTVKEYRSGNACSRTTGHIGGLQKSGPGSLQDHPGSASQYIKLYPTLTFKPIIAGAYRAVRLPPMLVDQQITTVLYSIVPLAYMPMQASWIL